MRKGRNIGIYRSNVVQRQVMRHGKVAYFAHAKSRYHRWLTCFAFIIGLAGAPGFALAGPPISAPTEDTGGGPTWPEDMINEQVAVRLFDEVFTQKKTGVSRQLMAANAINHTPTGDFEGPVGFELYVAEVWSAFPDATFVIDDGFTGDDLVTLRWSMTGRHLEAFGEHAATGVPVQLEGLAILRFEQNMIAESWLQYDRLSLVEQIEAPPVAPENCPPCQTP